MGPAAVPPHLMDVASRLPRGVRLGTSSWSFPGWAGLVYDRAASPSTLAREGLAAYARHPLLRTVGVDRTFYRPMPSEELRAYADAVPGDFRFLVKADRLLTSPAASSPGGVREPNPTFLDAEYARTMAVEPILEGLGGKAGPLLFQFPPIPPRSVGGAATFVRRLAAFLAALPEGPVYAVELRTPALLTDDYAAMLRDLGVAHGYTVHPAMAPLAQQLRTVRPFEQPALVIRWMLRDGLRYEAAKDRYEPFDRIVDEDEPSLDRIAVAALDALIAERSVYVVANNKAEGSAPLSVFRLAERIAAWDGAARSLPAAGEPAQGVVPTHSPVVTLRWLSSLLERVQVPYRVAGRAAAAAWGAEVGDVERLVVLIEAAGLPVLLPHLEPWVIRPPRPDPAGSGETLRLSHHSTTVDLLTRDPLPPSAPGEVWGIRIPALPAEPLLRDLEASADPRDVRLVAQLRASPEPASPTEG